MPIASGGAEQARKKTYSTTNIAAMAAKQNSMLTETQHDQAFENTSTSVAASQMRNALNNLADTVKDPKEKQVSKELYM